MKPRHLLILIAALLLTGICIASPFLISSWQNQTLINQISTTPAGSLNITPRELSHAEKLQLALNFATMNSSVTKTSLSQNSQITSLSGETQVCDTAKAEWKNLQNLLGLPASDSENLTNVSHTEAFAYVDRDDTSSYAILWNLSLASNTRDQQINLTFDDQSHRIYYFSYFNSSVDYPSVISGDSCEKILSSFADYLEMDLLSGENDMGYSNSQVTSYNFMLQSRDDKNIKLRFSLSLSPNTLSISPTN